MKIIPRVFGLLLVGASLVAANNKQEKIPTQEPDIKFLKGSLTLQPIAGNKKPKLTEEEFSKYIKDQNSNIFKTRDFAAKQIKGFTKELIKNHEFDHLEKVILRLQSEAKSNITLEYKRRIESLVSSETFEAYINDLYPNDFETYLKNLNSNNDDRVTAISTLARLGILNDEKNRDFLLWNIWRVPDKTLDFLIESGTEHEKITLAFSRYTPTKFLEKLSTDKFWNVRGHVARNDNKNITAQILINLSKDENYTVRYYVLRNPKKPPQIATSLIKDPNPYVRRAVAEEISDPYIASQIWADLAKEKDPFLRQVTANDKNTKLTTLFNLTNDEDTGVKNSAIKNLIIRAWANPIPELYREMKRPLQLPEFKGLYSN